ncbi:GAP family protein [Synechococcus sp. CS-1324]|uniref:GAP family protein n=1 Tax=Synechococcus sp. CS-1324 TaxID=2847980 RepID=UPI000DB758F3|nr:GAP family protein [Synechococcus sp. CS-1324]MCT0229934.1 GAP family protein [Synechococcus sp. CS-1324]PZV02452.1 MAG: cytochrome C biosynthesis protein [Cyanobium sp.]
MSDPRLWAELLAYGSGISLSPIHIGLLLLLLLGPNPLRRGGLFVLSWMVTIAVMVTLLLTVGHGLLLSMEQGSSHRTGLDLMGAGALLALGIRDLLPTKAAGSEPAGWIRQLDRFCALPLPLLIGVSAAIEVISPDDLFLLAKGASALLAADLDRAQELLLAGAFTLAASLLLLLPFLAVALARQSMLPLLQRGKQALYARGELVVGGLSLALAAYLAWQGIEGLRLA